MSAVIEVNTDSWHVKVYKWWYRTKWPHKGKPERTNLCPYVRTVLIWAPIRWLFYQGRIKNIRIPYVFIPTFLLSIPQPLGYVSFTIKWLLWRLNLIFACAAVVLGIVVGVTYISLALDEKYSFTAKYRKSQVLRQRRQLQKELDAERKPKQGPSFWQLIGRRIEAGHDRICPEIEFKNYEEPKNEAA